MTVNELNDKEYGSFYKPYIDICGDQDLQIELNTSLTSTIQLLSTIPQTKYDYRYQSDKWTIKELIQHLIDSERIFSYRALRFARNDKTELMGYDHDIYVPESESSRRDFSELIEEFKNVRQSTILLFKSFTEEMLRRNGVASNSNVTVRALGFIILGHSKHHLKILEERYL